MNVIELYFRLFSTEKEDFGKYIETMSGTTS